MPDGENAGSLLDTTDGLELLDENVDGEDQPVDIVSDNVDSETLNNQEYNEVDSNLQEKASQKLCGLESKSLNECPAIAPSKPNSQQNDQPVYNLEVTTDQKKCRFKPESPEQCPGDGYLIYPVDCASPRNSEVPNRLASWKIVYKTSFNKQCGGTLFWLAEKLSLDQANALRKMEGVVANVQSDFYGELEGVIMPRDSINEKSAARLFQKRDYDLSVTVQSNAPEHLAILSRSETDFLYFTNAGQDVTLYVVDSGVEPANDEFVTNSVLKYTLHSMHSDGIDSDLTGHGTCIVSLAAGHQYGSVKQLKTVMVKVGRSGLTPISRQYIAISDCLDGLQLILNDLYTRTQNHEKVKGHTVINLSLGFHRHDNDPSVLEMRRLLLQLITEYQVIITVAAGNYHNYLPTLTKIYRYPALFAPALPLIVVGGIDTTTQQPHRSSLPGPQLTILAPYQVTCAAALPGASSRTGAGTSFAAPITAGVIAGMLSGEWGDVNRARMGTGGFTMAKAMRDYVRRKGRKVGVLGGVKVVSNGLDARKKAPLYGWTL